MITYTCDRCGNGTSDLRLSLTITTGEPLDPPSLRIDLCGACRVDLRAWLKTAPAPDSNAETRPTLTD